MARPRRSRSPSRTGLVPGQPGPAPPAAELAELRTQLRQARETIEAIRSSGVNSRVTGPHGHQQLYTLAAADRPYRLIVEAMNEGAASVSPRGVILDANPRLCAMTGRTTAELVGTPALDLSTAAGRPGFARLLDVGADGSERGETELAGPDGMSIPVLLAVSGFDLDGMAVRCLVLTDLTAQRAVERRAEQVSQTLVEQRAFLDRAQAQAGFGWWIAELGPRHRLTASPQTLRILGLDGSPFDGRTETARAVIHPEDAPVVSAAARATLREGAPFQVEHRVVRPDGDVRWLRQSAVVDRDGAGAPIRALGICQDITERRLEEDKLRQASAYHRILIEATLDPMLAVDLDGKITDLNSAAARASGYSLKEVVGTDFSQYFTEPDVSRAYELVWREGSLRDFSLGLRRRDGGITPLLCNAAVYYDQSGRPLGVLASGHDVTEIRRAEAAVRESRERLSAVFDNAPVGIDDLTPGGQIVRANPRFCQLTGYTAEELAATNVLDLIHPEDRDADLAQTRRLLAGEVDHYTTERRFVRKGGDVVWAEVSRAIVRDDDGQPTLIVGAVRDLTGQREAESKLRAVAAYNRSLIEASLDPLIIIGADGNITDVNSAAEEATGCQRAELIGTDVSGYFTEPDLARAGYERVFREGAVRDYALELRHRDGRTMPVLYNASIYRDPDGNVAGVLAAARDVTAAKAAEEALRESEERFRAIFDNAPVGIDLMTTTGEVVQANPQFLRQLGYSPQDQRSLRMQDFSDPSHLAEDLGSIERLVAGEIDSYSAERRRMGKDGQARWFDVSRAVVRDQEGRPLEIVGVGRDITAQRQAEAELRTAAEYNQILLETTPEPLVAVGLDGVILQVNRAAEQISGFRSSELTGRHLSEFSPAPSLVREVLDEVVRAGAVHDALLEVRHRDGHLLSMLCNAVTYRDAAGELLGILVSGYDVTRIERTEAALRESQERLSALVDSAPIGIAEMSPSGQVVRANARICQMTGYTAAEMMSMHIGSLSPPGDHDADVANSERLLSGEIDSYSLDRRYVRKGGEIAWAEVNRAVVRDANGEPQTIISTLRDITAQREAEAQVRTLNAELGARVRERTADLERANKNLEAFTYSVSHDLRAPLRALSGFSQALVEDYGEQLDETGRGYADRIQAASERMAALIDDLLHLSRVSRADMSVRPVHLSAEVVAIAAELRSAEPDRSVRFDIAEGVRATADRVLIRSVLQNLLENAWKFTARRDDALIEFGTTATEDDTEIGYYVKDNGAGFDPAYVGKLFNPFQRLHAGTDFPGTGIGLASVRRIVERHGGRTWAEGAIDQGATFYFTLPKAASAAR